MHCSAKRLFPNFSFLDAPFNAQYYKGTPETEIAYMGCRTRVMGNVFDPDREVTPGRGNLSFTSINLPRLAIRAKGDLDLFFDCSMRSWRSWWGSSTSASRSRPARRCTTRRS